MKIVESNSTKLVSVIIPTFNRSGLILDSVNSVLNQTYHNIELIVVDDGSTDNTIELLSKIKDGRLNVISTEGRQGANHARNLGVKASNGEIIAFQDSDDKWLVDKLEKQMSCLIKTGVDAVFCSFIRVTPTTVSILPFQNLREAMVANNGKALIENCLRFNVISTQTLLIKRPVFEELNGFDNSLKRLQDWDLAIRLLNNYNATFLDIPLVNVYEQSDSISVNQDTLLESQKMLIDKHIAIYNKFPMIYYRMLYRYFKLKLSSLI